MWKPCTGCYGPCPKGPQPGPHLSKDRPDERGQALGPRLPLDRLCRLQKQGHSGLAEQRPHPIFGILKRHTRTRAGGGRHPQASPSADRPPQHAGPHLLGTVQGRPLVQLAVWAWPDGGGKCPDGALLSVLSISIPAAKGKRHESPEGQDTPLGTPMLLSEAASRS